MKNINMQKVVYISSNVLIPYTIQYKELEKELDGQNQVTAQFANGMRNKRIKQLEKLGFKLAEYIWNPCPNNDSVADTVKAVFVR